MKSFMKRILLENGFSIDENCLKDERAFQADRLDGNGFDFLTVSFMNQDQMSEDTLTENIQRFRSAVSEENGAIVGMDKNLSLLIMLKVDSLDHPPAIQSLIFDIEEDPYTFKKYILTYTGEQESLLTSLFKESGQDVTSFLYKILYDTEKFSTFKNRETNENALVYDLVSKMFIKLPYLSIKNQHKEMDLLLNDILESFGENDRGTWDALMGLREQNGSDPSIEAILKAVGVDDGE
ncbi:ABC-three component system middle component 1 [Neobacillus jeddahensis]|uniref:ABC-three component system middle component 1 n=1 Tax=Neobacillus jeddahensis TaxID=1461580 RepID=UPI0005906194|nr:ABC-three component system middle component 1 [Neobacillus jeddahensis]